MNRAKHRGDRGVLGSAYLSLQSTLEAVAMNFRGIIVYYYDSAGLIGDIILTLQLSSRSNLVLTKMSLRWYIIKILLS